jgi:hypothetical protein
VSDSYTEARHAAYAARYGELVDTYTWNSAADVTLAAAAPFIAAGERERIASAIPADTIDGLADYLIRVGAKFEGPAAVPDLPARLKLLANLIREGTDG